MLAELPDKDQRHSRAHHRILGDTRRFVHSVTGVSAAALLTSPGGFDLGSAGGAGARPACGVAAGAATQGHHTRCPGARAQQGPPSALSAALPSV